MKIAIALIIVSLVIFNCTSSNEAKLNDSDIEYIQNLGLLEPGEKVLAYSTSYNKKTSGNFVTEKRISSYWLGKDNKENFKNYAFFSDIIKIDSMDLTKAWTYSSYLTITKKDSSKFKVYIDGDRDKYLAFCKIAIKNWRLNNKNVP